MSRSSESPKSRSLWLRAGLLLAIALAGWALYATFDLGRFLDIEYLKSRQADLEALYEKNPLAFAAAFFLIYVAATGLSIPGAAVLTILAGFLFGRWTGTLLVSFASTSGATLAFLLSRYLLGRYVEERWASRLEKLYEGFRREGAFYLFTLRLIPAVPFWLINLGMGLTPIRTRTFWWVSQVGMLPGTFVYVNAGTELARLDPSQGVGGILTPELIVSFAALGFFPLAARTALRWIGRRRSRRSTPLEGRPLPESGPPSDSGAGTPPATRSA